eukprot:jgi/Chrzof1/11726/Cz06g07060.t1
MFSLADMLEQHAGSRVMSFHSQGSYLRVCTFSYHVPMESGRPQRGQSPVEGGPWGVYAALLFQFMKKSNVSINKYITMTPEGRGVTRPPG